MMQQREPQTAQNRRPLPAASGAGRFDFRKASFLTPRLEPQVHREDRNKDSVVLPPEDKITLDKVGIGLSALCTFKCLGIPLLAAMPVGGLLTWAHKPVVVLSLTALSLFVAGSQLIYKELRAGRVLTPVAAVISGLVLSIGAIGHSKAVNDLNNLDSIAASSCMCGCSPHMNKQLNLQNNVSYSVLESSMSNAHTNLLFGAFALGSLHLLRFRRNLHNRKLVSKGKCGRGDACKCESLTEN